jgi:hypothetical protein
VKRLKRLKGTSPVNILLGEASPEKKRASVKPLSRAPAGPPFERRARATRRPQGGAAGGGARARGCRNWHGARATSSVDGWASTGAALRTRGRGGGCEAFRAPPRAWADSSKRASEPDAEPPPRARWSTHFSPRAPVSLTRRLRRAVALCGLKSPGSRLRPPFFGDVTFFFTITAPPW